MKKWSEDKSTFIRRVGASKLWRMALLGLAIFHLVAQLAIVAPREIMRTDVHRDVIVYWKAAENVNYNRPIYTAQPNYGPGHTPESVYIYPPPFAAIISLLSKLSFHQFAALFVLLNLSAFWIFCWHLASLAGCAGLRGTLICGLGAALFPGTYSAIGLGQVDPMLWALFAAGLAGMAQPSLWALASLIKVFYVWPLFADIIHVTNHDSVIVLLKRFIPAATIIGALVLYGGYVCGWNTYIIWARDVLPTLSQGNFKPDNVSLSFAVLRVAHFLGWNYAVGPLPTLPHLWLTVASIVAPLLAGYFTRQCSRQICYASMIAAAVLFAPVCWTCYLPLLLPLCALLFKQLKQQIQQQNELLQLSNSNEP